MGSTTRELIDVLDQLIDLLKSDGQTHWAKWVRESKTRLISSEVSGAIHLLSAYGGMGSFNDLVICQRNVNGQFCWADGHLEKNERLSELRSKAWRLADEIKGSHPR